MEKKLFLQIVTPPLAHPVLSQKRYGESVHEDSPKEAQTKGRICPLLDYLHEHMPDNARKQDKT